MSSGALPGPGLLRAIPGVLCGEARGARVELGGGGWVRRRLCLRVVSAAVESRLCMSSGALPGPDLLRVFPGVLCRRARGARVRAWRGGLLPASWTVKF